MYTAYSCRVLALNGKSMLRDFDDVRVGDDAFPVAMMQLRRAGISGKKRGASTQIDHLLDGEFDLLAVLLVDIRNAALPGDGNARRISSVVGVRPQVVSSPALIASRIGVRIAGIGLLAHLAEQAVHVGDFAQERDCVRRIHGAAIRGKSGPAFIRALQIGDQ